MKNIFGLTVEELQDVLKDYSVQKFRARQIAEWMYQKGATSFDAMTNLSKKLREQLAGQLTIGRAKLIDRQNSADGKTSKFLLEFLDGVAVEAVLMRQPYGNSICVSTQAGCNMGCAFCASTLHGLARNLTAGDMLSQAIAINDMLRQDGEKVDTMVLMGSGEPLLNYDEVIKFLHLIHEDYTLGMGYRNITLSTSGIVPGMLKLAEEGLPISLAISLHAPTQELRTKIMPIAKKYPLDEVIAAAKNYADKTKRRITYEYILIDHLNDGEEQARELVRLLKGQLCNVNLIPINPVVERNLLRPSKTRIDWFEKYLTEHHIAVMLRREMGTDIQAACGQLRNKHLN